MDTGGVGLIEGSVEGQAGISINLGVAAGAVMARLGIYFRYALSSNSLTLEAFFEIHGEMSVLGLISVSVTFHVGLAASKSDGEHRVDLYGTATITVEIEFAFFSKSVDVQCERRFGGSDADPTFADVFPADRPDHSDRWAEYAQAFA